MPSDTSPTPPNPSQSRGAAVAVWDLPVRICHWSLVILLVTAVVAAKIGGDAMEIHLKAGYGVVVLVAFRLLWGFVGTRHARFGSFVRGIPSIVAYCRQMRRNEPYEQHGHNPVGGWMVVVILAALAIQSGTGLFADDDIMTEGPLTSLVAKDTSDWLTAIHKLNFKVLAALAGLHVAAIAFYLAVKRINLLGPMITGRVAVAAEHPRPARSFPAHTNMLALTLLAMVAAGFYLLVPAA